MIEWQVGNNYVVVCYIYSRVCFYQLEISVRMTIGLAVASRLF